MKFQRCQSWRRFPWSTLPRGSCPLRLAQPPNQIVVEQESQGWISMEGPGAAPVLCMRCCHEPVHRCMTCARKHVGNAPGALRRHRAFRLVLAVAAEQDTSLGPGSPVEHCTGMSATAAGGNRVPRAPGVHWEHRMFPQQQPGLLRPVSGRGDPPRCVRYHVCAAGAQALWGCDPGAEGHCWASGPDPASSSLLQALDPNPIDPGFQLCHSGRAASAGIPVMLSFPHLLQQRCFQLLFVNIDFFSIFTQNEEPFHFIFCFVCLSDRGFLLSVASSLHIKAVLC